MAFSEENPLLPFPEGTVAGHFVRRFKRFFVEARIGGETVLAHTNNTGTMLGLLKEGARALFSPAKDPRRKLRWTLEALRVESGARQGDAAAFGGFWAGVNTSVPNRLLEAAYHAGLLPWAAGYSAFRREVRRGESRLDACLEGQGLPALWVECKNVTLVEDGAALFPDAPSARALKHLGTLRQAVAAGERGLMFYVIQRPDAVSFGPASHIDPAYAAGFAGALAAGVELCAAVARVTERGVFLHSLTQIGEGNSRQRVFPSPLF